MGPLAIRLLLYALLTVALVVLSRNYEIGQLSYALLGLAIVIAAMIAMAPPTIVLLFEWVTQTSKAARWHSRQGQHYEFVGIPLDLREDGEHAWMRADGLKRVLELKEPDDVFAARVASGCWVREGRWLWVRVDAVVRHLAEAPDRDAPRRRRLRQHLEREVLTPLQRRRGGDRMAATAETDAATSAAPPAEAAGPGAPAAATAAPAAPAPEETLSLEPRDPAGPASPTSRRS